VAYHQNSCSAQDARFIVIDGTGCGEDHLVGTVVLADKPDRSSRVKFDTRSDAPKEWCVDGAGGIGLFLQPIENHVVRRVLGAGDLCRIAAL